MSNIGKKSIIIPEGVNVNISNSNINVKGKLGELNINYDYRIKISKSDKEINVSRNSDERKFRELHGLYRALVYNMVLGVSEGFKKELVLVGVGYTVEKKGEFLLINAGYSHPIYFQIPDGIINGKVIEYDSKNLIDVGLYEWPLYDSSHFIQKIEADEMGNFQFIGIENGRYSIVAIEGVLWDMKKQIENKKYAILTSDFISITPVEHEKMVEILLSEPLKKQKIVSVEMLSQHSFNLIMDDKTEDYFMIDSLYKPGDSISVNLAKANRLETYMLPEYSFILPEITDTLSPRLTKSFFEDEKFTLEFSEPVQLNTNAITTIWDTIYYPQRYVATSSILRFQNLDCNEDGNKTPAELRWNDADDNGDWYFDDFANCNCDEGSSVESCSATCGSAYCAATNSIFIQDSSYCLVDTSLTDKIETQAYTKLTGNESYCESDTTIFVVKGFCDNVNGKYDEEEIFLGRSVARHQHMSEETSRKVDAEIRKLVEKGYERAKKVLNEKIDDLHKLAKALLTYETLTGTEIEDLINKNVFPTNKENLRAEEEGSSALGSIGLKPKIVH